MSVFKIIGTPSSQVNGVLLLKMRSQYFLDIMRNVKVSPNGYLALVSPDGTLLSKTSEAQYRIEEPVLRELVGKGEESEELWWTGAKLALFCLPTGKGRGNEGLAGRSSNFSACSRLGI
jgi:hypothetical protein